MRFKIKKSNIAIYLYCIICFFVPYYRTPNNNMNAIFSFPGIAIIILVLLIFCNWFKTVKIKDRPFLGILVFIYGGVSFYVNWLYKLECEWLLLVQLTSMIFLYYILTHKFRYNCDLENMCNIITDVFALSNVVSILFRIIGGDAVIFYNSKFFFRYQGNYMDNRLTFVYPHKSVYGLLCVIFIVLLLEKKYLRNRTKKLIAACVALVFTNGLMAIGCGIISITVYFVKGYWEQMKIRDKVIAFFMFLVEFLILGYAIFSVVGAYRDINSFGHRWGIWNYGLEYLKLNPEGIGSEYQHITFGAKSVGFLFNNFHNYFLNRMLQYSVITGMLILIIFICFVVITLRHSQNKIFSCVYWGCFILPLMFDNAISEDYLPIYFLVITLVFMSGNEVVEVENRKGSLENISIT